MEKLLYNFQMGGKGSPAKALAEAAYEQDTKLSMRYLNNSLVTVLLSAYKH